jgi:MATE family multidrug resistance protein
MESNSQPTNDAPGGYREVLAISVPLILSTSSMSLMHVVDRIFLSWYSPEALAAALPAGAASWALLSLFIGASGYVSTFVSQYDGAGRPERIGAAMWQGIYFSAIASVLCALMYFVGEPLFHLANHPPAVRENEIICFQVMTVGGGASVFAASLSAFYSGRGKTSVVMWVNFGGALLNAVLDYLWIFGKGGFPEWGIFGAALASVVAPAVMCVAYLFLLFLPANRLTYHTLSAWRFEKDLFGRLLRFGLPGGLQFMIDVSAFTTFVLLIGRLGEIELAASNVAFAINQLIFMPMVGLSLGTSVLVGRYLGAETPDIAASSTLRSLWLAMAYMGGFSLAIFLWPDAFIAVFDPGNEETDFHAVQKLTRRLLYFVAAYSVLDALNIVFSSALKGAGDTRFVSLTALCVAFTVLVVPVYLSCVVYGRGIYTAWFFLSLWVVALATVFWLRFQGGKWRSMRVIEHYPAPAAAVQEGPVVDV